MYIFLQSEIGVKHVLKRKIISKLLRLGRCPHKIENILLYHVNTTNNKLGLESLKALLQYFASPASFRVHIICPQSEKNNNFSKS